MFDKIFYINLPNRSDRNKNIINQLNKLKLSDITERIKALVGTKLDINAISSNLITDKGKRDALSEFRMDSTYLTKGSIGCALSHRKIYKKMVSENIACALILEDDVTINNNNFTNFIKDHQQYIPKNYDILFVGYHDDCIKYQSSSKHFYTRSSVVLGTFGYIVTKKGAQKLLDLFPISRQLDTEIFLNFNKINAYVLLPDKRFVKSANFGTDTQS